MKRAQNIITITTQLAGQTWRVTGDFKLQPAPDFVYLSATNGREELTGEDLTAFVRSCDRTDMLGMLRAAAAHEASRLEMVGEAVASQLAQARGVAGRTETPWRIVSDGMGHGTHVYYQGKKVEMIEAVSLSVAGRGVVSATITVPKVSVEIAAADVETTERLHVLGKIGSVSPAELLKAAVTQVGTAAEGESALVAALLERQGGVATLTSEELGAAVERVQAGQLHVEEPAPGVRQVTLRAPGKAMDEPDPSLCKGDVAPAPVPALEVVPEPPPADPPMPEIPPPVEAARELSDDEAEELL